MWARSALYHWITYKVWICWGKKGSRYTVWPWMYHVVGTSPALGSSLGCLCFLLCIYFLWIKPLSLERGGCLLKTQKVDTTHKFQEASETCSSPKSCEQYQFLGGNSNLLGCIELCRTSQQFWLNESPRMTESAFQWCCCLWVTHVPLNNSPPPYSCK